MKKYGHLKCNLISLALILAFNSGIFGQCGSERWNAKILNDAEAADINFIPKISTVHKQLTYPKPVYHEDNLRDATEKVVYKINCKLVKYRVEDDSDWHLVVQDLNTNEKIVVEIPNLHCINQSNPHFSKIDVSKKRLKAKVGPVTNQFRKALAGTKLQITGVGFFDKDNHPIGFKGREIHPVLELKVL